MTSTCLIAMTDDGSDAVMIVAMHDSDTAG